MISLLKMSIYLMRSTVRTQKIDSKTNRPFLSTLPVYLSHNLLSSISTKRMNWNNERPRTLLSSSSFHFSVSPDSLCLLPNELGSSLHRNWSPHHLTIDPATNEKYPDRILALWRPWKWHHFGKGKQLLSRRPQVEGTKARKWQVVSSVRFRRLWYDVILVVGPD